MFNYLQKSDRFAYPSPDQSTASQGSESGDTPGGEENSPPNEDGELSDEDPEASQKECPGTDVSVWDDIVKPFALAAVEGFVIGGALGVVSVAFAPWVGLALGGAMLGLGIVALVQTAMDWNQMTTRERWQFGSAFAGGLLGGLAGFRWGQGVGRGAHNQAGESPPPTNRKPQDPPGDETASGKNPPRVIDVDSLPHNRFLHSPEYAEGLSKGAPELYPVGRNGGGFKSAEAGPIKGHRTLYRIGTKDGTWWSDQPPPKTVEAWRQRDGVIPEWNKHYPDGVPNEFWKIEIPPGKEIPMAWKGEGAPAYQGGKTYVAGETQYKFDPTPFETWIKEYHHKWK